jgi:hypothetical protein
MAVCTVRPREAASGRRSGRLAFPSRRCHPALRRPAISGALIRFANQNPQNFTSGSRSTPKRSFTRRRTSPISATNSAAVPVPELTK